MIDLIEKTMARKRVEIPTLNRKKYDIETADFYSAIKAAESDAEMEKLFAEWLERAAYLAACRNAWKAPAKLVRKKNESVESYLERIYERSGICRIL